MEHIKQPSQISAPEGSFSIPSRGATNGPASWASPAATVDTPYFAHNARETWSGSTDTCTTCCAGMGPSPDKTTCIPCVNNEYSPFGVCQNCTEGLRPNVDRTACLECPEGAAQTSTDGECACSAGYYNVGLFAEGAGTDESAGTAVPRPGVAPSPPPPLPSQTP